MSIEFDELDKARESADDKQGLFQIPILKLPIQCMCVEVSCTLIWTSWIKWNWWFSSFLNILSPMCQLFTQLHNLSSLFHRHILSLLLQFWLISLTRKVMEGIWIYMNAMRSLSTWKAYLKWTTSHIWPPLIKCLTCPRIERMRLTRSKLGHLYFLSTGVWTLNVFCRYQFLAQDLTYTPRCLDQNVGLNCHVDVMSTLYYA